MGIEYSLESTTSIRFSEKVELVFEVVRRAVSVQRSSNGEREGSESVVGGVNVESPRGWDSADICGAILPTTYDAGSVELSMGGE